MKMKRYKKAPGWNRILGLPIAYEVSAGAAVVRRTVDGGWEALLLRYPHGHWDFPKGHIEAGETIEETVRREVHEETGLDDLRILPGFRQSIHFHYVAKGTERVKRLAKKRSLRIFKTVYFFLAESRRGEIVLSDEHVGGVWLPIDRAIDRATFDNARRILREAKHYLNKKRKP